MTDVHRYPGIAPQELERVPEVTVTQPGARP